MCGGKWQCLSLLIVSPVVTHHSCYKFDHQSESDCDTTDVQRVTHQIFAQCTPLFEVLVGLHASYMWTDPAFSQLVRYIHRCLCCVRCFNISSSFKSKWENKSRTRQPCLQLGYIHFMSHYRQSQDRNPERLFAELPTLVRE